MNSFGLTKASLNCQKVGFMRSLTQEGAAASRVQAVLEKKQTSSIVQQQPRLKCLLTSDSEAEFEIHKLLFSKMKSSMI